MKNEKSEKLVKDMNKTCEYFEKEIAEGYLATYKVFICNECYEEYHGERY